MGNPNTIYDCDWNSAQPDGLPKFSAPFDGVSTDYLLEQDFVQRQTYFEELALGTPHDTYTAFVLVKESPLQPVGTADIVKWTRTYAKVPATRSDYSTMTYNFIGYWGYIKSVDGSVTANIPGRKRFARSVTCRIQYDYFLVGSGQTYTTPEAIPTFLEQIYYFRVGSASTSLGVTTWTPTYTAGSVLDRLEGCPTDYLSDTAADGSPYISGIVPCVPSRSQYMALVQSGAEIIAEASSLTRWMGNIYVRTTKYINAQ